jgi:environmental stress-induced protein Ves
MQVLRHQDYKRMPWKNGLGITEEVMAFPPASDIGTFGWRLSIAHVGADGPFSVFAGIDRTIALLDGDGLSLDFPEGRTVELTPRSEPLAFSGDLEISSRNKSGKTIDLNIMTRRGQFRHRMKRIGSGVWEITQPGTILVFNGEAKLNDESMQRFDAAIVEPEDGPQTIEAGDDVAIFLIELSEWR